MGEYFGDYPGAKSLPSPADTPYETPAFIRSKRSSRVTLGESSREDSNSPPLLPQDTLDVQEKPRDGRYPSLDPRRFTPTLHASLVSEILSLRRDLDSKNNLVENLETSLAESKNDNDVLSKQVADGVRDIRKARQQVRDMEAGAYAAVEDLVKERDAAIANVEELRVKLDSAGRKTRQQDEDAMRTQSIWETEKEAWEGERRQLERRVHITETRLRVFVDGLAAQQASSPQSSTLEQQTAGDSDPFGKEESLFKDSALGHESETASLRSPVSLRHKRNMSSLGSIRVTGDAHNSISSTAVTPDLQVNGFGQTLADELEDEDEEDDYDLGEDAEDGSRCVESRQSTRTVDADPQSKQALETDGERPETPLAHVPASQHASPSKIQNLLENGRRAPGQGLVPISRRNYVDNGYQPSPPVSPERRRKPREFVSDTIPRGIVVQRGVQAYEKLEATSLQRDSPPAQTNSARQSKELPSATIPETVSLTAKATYSSTSTQTDTMEADAPAISSREDISTVSSPLLVPSIAIHRPATRPSSPMPYALPPGTKNASTQAELPWPRQDASMQTEEIRIDKRLSKLPAHLLPTHLLPSPTFQEQKRQRKSADMGPGTAAIFTAPKLSSPQSSPDAQSPVESSPEYVRDAARDYRSLPLKAMALPRPKLSPPRTEASMSSLTGPLNRSSQYGVSKPRTESLQLTDIDGWSDHSDYDDPVDGSDFDAKDLASSIPSLSRAPQGRFGLSNPPKSVPEHKEISPERRPQSSGSTSAAAPAPSISSSRGTTQRKSDRAKPKPSHRDHRSRSPSFGSMGSSSHNSTQSGIPQPPYPIPQRSSSKHVTKTHSEGSASPITEKYGSIGHRKSRLRKVQSAALIRDANGKISPQRHARRRRRSPNLTPVQSMAFESPTATQFEIPELPMPSMDTFEYDHVEEPCIARSSNEPAELDADLLPEVNLVDAIAATMVGEWMWKYIRKRKSFGIGEDNSEIPVADENGEVSITGHGTRHKRWVWLSPYERTIMWDNKQPTSGSALLGKKGRKLVIQSVLDVQDLTPLPKNPELRSAWHRSIMILTPQRALKFTAVDQERHRFWMTALSFLAQSNTSLPNQVSPAPTSSLQVPPDPIDGVPIKRYRSPPFGRSTVRDSIRLAKGKRPDSFQKPPPPSSAAAHHSSALSASTNATDSLNSHTSDTAAAEPPSIPRLANRSSRHDSSQHHHSRKRSNTSPRVPPSSLSTFRNPLAMSSTPSTSTIHHAATSSTSTSTIFRHPLAAASTKSAGSAASHSASASAATSYRDSTSIPAPPQRAPPPPPPNFFEAVGTVRMEAFVDPNVRDGVLYVPAPPSAGAAGMFGGGMGQGFGDKAAPPPANFGLPSRKRGDSSLSQSTVDRRRAGYVFDEEGLDPFRGF